MFGQRKKWIKQRFGNINEKILGKIEETKEISWPNPVRECEVKGNKLRWQMVENIENSAKRIAEMYINGIDELAGNSEYEWHHIHEEIIKKVKTGDWNFYGCYFDDKLISAVSLHIIRGQRAIQWIWGVVDPIYRGKGVWQKMAEYLDLVTKESGAQMGFFFVVTTHKYSQMSVERTGYRPMGLFIGGEFMGGSDGHYYRQNVIYYGKLYGDGKKYLQDCDTMELTENAGRLVNTIKELWKS